MTERITIDPFGPEADAFVAHMRRQERSPKTIDAYLWSLKHFRRFFGDRQVTSFAGITRELLEEWQDYLATTPSPQTHKPLVPRSRALASTAIRMFFLFAAQRELCDAKLALQGKPRDGYAAWTLTVPAHVARSMPRGLQGVLFTCELTEDGILFRPLLGSAPKIELPGWIEKATRTGVNVP